MKRLILYPSILSLAFWFCDSQYQLVLAAEASRHVAEYSRYQLIIDSGVANEADWAWIHSGICATDSECERLDSVERLHIEYEPLSFTDERE